MTAKRRASSTVDWTGTSENRPLGLCHVKKQEGRHGSSWFFREESPTVDRDPGHGRLRVELSSYLADGVLRRRTHAPEAACPRDVHE